MPYPDTALVFDPVPGEKPLTQQLVEYVGVRTVPGLVAGTLSTLSQLVASPVNVKLYGAVMDPKSNADGAITSGLAVLTSASGTFTAADQGKTIMVRGAGAAGVPLVTTILTYTSATQVTLAANASTTVTGALYVYATDDTTAVQAAINNAAPSGTVLIPGLCAVTSTIVSNGRVRLLGTGRADSAVFGATTTAVLRGSGLVAMGAFTVLDVGQSGGSTNRHNSVEEMGIHCMGVADGIKMSSPINMLSRVTVDRAVNIGVDIESGSFCDLDFVRVINNYSGRCIVVNGIDARLSMCVTAHASTTAGTPQVDVLTQNSVFIGHHFSAGTQTSAEVGGYLRFIPDANLGFMRVIGGRCDKTDNTHILVKPGAGLTDSHLNIIGTEFFISSQTTDNTANCIHLDASVGAIHGVTIIGCNAASATSASKFARFVKRTNPTSQKGVTITGNTVKHVTTFVDTPDTVVSAGNRVWDAGISDFVDPITNVNIGASGLASGVVVKYMYADAAVSVGDLLRAGTTTEGRVRRTATVSDPVVGVALDASTGGDLIRVAVLGVVQLSVLSATATTPGVVLGPSATAGIAAATGGLGFSGNRVVAAVALTTDAGGAGDRLVWVFVNPATVPPLSTPGAPVGLANSAAAGSGAGASRADHAHSATLAEGVNLVFGTTTGTKIGTATSQKLGFYNVTPIVQPTVTGSRGGNAALASLLTQLASLGLIVDSSTA